LAQDPGRDPDFALEIADAYRSVAYVEGAPLRGNLGQTTAALDHYQKSIAIYSSVYWGSANRAETKAHALGGLIGANIEAGDIESRTGNAAAAAGRLTRVAALASEATARDPTALYPGTWVYLYFRLGEAERRAGAIQETLVYARKALEVSLRWATTDRSMNARSTLRGAYNMVAGALRDTGDLYGARDNYETALKRAEDDLRQPDARVYERSTLSGAHQNLADILGNPEFLNLGDRPGAISHSRTALEIEEAIAASDRHDVRARDDLVGAYRTLGMILLEDQPVEALKSYQKAVQISEELTAAYPSNTKYREDLAAGQEGIGKCLHSLGKNREALLKLAPALDTMKALAAAAPERIALTGAVGRIHDAIGNALLAVGDEKGALENYRQALAIAEELMRRAPSNLYSRRQHADALEALGRYYGTLARRRKELKA